MRPHPARILQHHPVAPSPTPTPTPTPVTYFMQWSPAFDSPAIAPVPATCGPDVWRQTLTTNGDLTAVQAWGIFALASGKFYHEARLTNAGLDGNPDPNHGDISHMVAGVTQTTNFNVGVERIQDYGTTVFGTPGFGCVLRSDGMILNADGGDGGSLGITLHEDDIVMVAVDLDASKVWFGANGTWLTGTPYVSGGHALLPGLNYTPCGASWNRVNDTGQIAGWNYPVGGGVGCFNYTPPAPALPWQY